LLGLGSDREGLGLGIIDRRSEPNTVQVWHKVFLLHQVAYVGVNHHHHQF